jgi:hypothetical protein
MAFSQGVFTRGPRPVRAITKEARAAGIAPRTLIRARYAMRLIATRQGWTVDGYWIRRLPETADVAQKDARVGDGILLRSDYSR